MKNIIILFSILFYAFLLSGCGGSSKGGNTGGNVVTTPKGPNNSLTTVRLKAENMGNVSYIDFGVALPAGTKENLLDYNGQAKVTGTIQTVPAIPCLANRTSFSCTAQFSAGNIQINGCSMGGHSISLTIVLFRGLEIKTTYNVVSIIINADQSCYLSK